MKQNTVYGEGFIRSLSRLLHIRQLLFEIVIAFELFFEIQPIHLSVNFC